MFSLLKKKASNLFRLEGTTRFFGRQVPAHRNLGCLCSFLGAILFWVFFGTLLSRLIESTGLSTLGMWSLILFCSIEAFLRGIWVTVLLKRYALFYVLLSIFVAPLTAPLWVWVYGFWNIFFVIYGLVIALSAMAGVGITRLLQTRNRKLAA